MKTSILSLFALVPFFGYGQNSRQSPIDAEAASKRKVPTEYMQQAVAFIRQVESSGISNPKFILADSSVSLNSNNCLQYIDKQFYSPAELKLIESRVAFWRCQWKRTDFPASKFISCDTVRVIFNSRYKGWDYFHKNIGPDFNEFSMPIFFRNNTYCLFYSANYCGSLCAEGSLRLYKKKSNKWELAKSYCNWVS